MSRGDRHLGRGGRGKGGGSGGGGGGKAEWKGGSKSLFTWMNGRL